MNNMFYDTISDWKRVPINRFLNYWDNGIIYHFFLPFECFTKVKSLTLRQSFEYSEDFILIVKIYAYRLVNYYK